MSAAGPVSQREVTLTRRVIFSSGHRYWRSDLSEAENRERFGPYASPFNHGHNYVLYASVAGPVEAEHGMVVNIKDIDAILKQRVLAPLNLKSLNDEVPDFASQTPTTENLLRWIGERLQDLPEPARLTHLRLDEYELLYGELIMTTANLSEARVQITRIYEFAASHRLHVAALPEDENRSLFGKCTNPNGHGHNYILEVTVSGTVDPETGMIAPLDVLDRVVHEEVVDRYDHQNLNLDVPELAGLNPTSEVVAAVIFDRLNDKVPATLERIRLFETARNIFEVNRS